VSGAHPPVDWRERFNAVHVRIEQHIGLISSWAELRAVGVRVRVDAKQFTDRSRSHTPIARARTLGLVGLKARWERDRMLHDTPNGPVGRPLPAVLTLRRPGKPDVFIPGLRASDADLDAVCDALARAAEAAASLEGHGRAEVPRALRSLLGEVEEP
jgi:hypothetical protein